MIIDFRDYLYNRLKKTKITQIKYYDVKYLFISFNMKNKVLINFKNIKITKSVKKLNHKYYDSFKIELFIQNQTYRFHLFKTFKSIHNVFHVLLLKSHRKNFEKPFSSIMMGKKNNEK